MIEQEIRTKLFNIQDKKYQEFHQKLCPNTPNIIGVKTPLIKQLVKEYTNKYEFDKLYKINPVYYEEIMLKGLLINSYKVSFEILEQRIKEFIPLINNWAICDTFCASLKQTKKYKKEIRNFITKYKTSKKEYELRFMLVMIIDFYITEEYLDDNFKIFDSIKTDYYYVNMAISWAISICLIKFYKETIKYLKTSKINDFVYKKSLQKAIESYRINDVQKEELKKLKNNR